MSDPLARQRVSCSRCRYRFYIEVPPGEDWQVEEACPCCDAESWFTVADTHDPPPPSPEELEEQGAERQRVSEEAWRPVNEHRDHPAAAWIDRIGNGLCEDDYSHPTWSIPHWWVYRFTRGPRAAYIWQDNYMWYVRGWHPLRGSGTPPEPVRVDCFEAALDELVE